MPETIDHDRLFKELLTTFFFEFLELFVPDVARYIDRESLVFLDKEVFTDVTSGEKHEVDIVARARFQDRDRFFLVHVENQASQKPQFPRRMFVYFARLFERHGLDVYLIVLFSYDRPKRAEPKQFQIAFPDKRVLQFEYTVVQLNRLDWRSYVSKPNPIAAALMAKMQVAPKERRRVTFECLRLLATLKLNPAKARLIAGFVHTYLRLNAAETTVLQREIEALGEEERQTMLELTNPWIEQGREEGLAKGREEGERRGELREAQALLLRLGGKRLGTPSEEIQTWLAATEDRDLLENLIERVLDVESWQELFTAE